MPFKVQHDAESFKENLNFLIGQYQLNHYKSYSPENLRLALEENEIDQSDMTIIALYQVTENINKAKVSNILKVVNNINRYLSIFKTFDLGLTVTDEKSKSLAQFLVQFLENISQPDRFSILNHDAVQWAMKKCLKGFNSQAFVNDIQLVIKECHKLILQYEIPLEIKALINTSEKLQISIKEINPESIDLNSILLLEQACQCLALNHESLIAKIDEHNSLTNVNRKDVLVLKVDVSYLLSNGEEVLRELRQQKEVRRCGAK